MKKELLSKKPIPEDFGLTEEKINKWKQIPNSYFTWSSILIGIIIAMIYFNLAKPNDILNIVGTIWVVYIISFMIGILIYPFIKYIGIKIIPKYRKEHENILKYRDQLSIWLRQREEWWKSLDGRSFEKEIGNLFMEKGYNVIHTGKSGDEGIDLVVEKDNKKAIVQCKVTCPPKTSPILSGSV